MHRDDDPGANTEMFRIYVQGGEAPAETRPAVRIAVLLAVAAVVVVALVVILLA